MLASYAPDAVAPLVVGLDAFRNQDLGLKAAHELFKRGLTHLRTQTSNPRIRTRKHAAYSH
ncbi:protein of unknown function [Hyphomicrobium sp. MC1]|nr:protein of unknown function [Hyphomicrobium sp. MC1]